MNSTITIRRTLSARIRAIRIEKYGQEDEGLDSIGAALGLPAATWRNYEDGVIMPAEVLLKFMELTRVNTRWLLTGKGPRYSQTCPGLKYTSMN